MKFYMLNLYSVIMNIFFVLNYYSYIEKRNNYHSNSTNYENSKQLLSSSPIAIVIIVI